MRHFFRQNMAMDVSYLAPFPDLFALLIVLILTAILTLGARESTRFNNVFTCCNLLVVIYVITCGLFRIDFHNWNIQPEEIAPSARSTAGSGGFLPFGFSGVVAGAATCFFGFQGFDSISTASKFPFVIYSSVGHNCKHSNDRRRSQESATQHSDGHLSVSAHRLRRLFRCGCRFDVNMALLLTGIVSLRRFQTFCDVYRLNFATGSGRSDPFRLPTARVARCWVGGQYRNSFRSFHQFDWRHVSFATDRLRHG